MADIPVLYTSTNAIRSSIGIDENDISDGMLLACNLDLLMLERLEEILPNYEAVFDGSDAGERRLKLWCQYFGALALLEDASLGIPQKIQANNDQLSRFTLDFEAIKNSLRARLAAIQVKMVAVPTLPVTPTLFSKSSPDFDPITG